jgi:hypothetical protein
MKKLGSVLYAILLVLVRIPAIAGMVSAAPTYFNHHNQRRQHRGMAEAPNGAAVSGVLGPRLGENLESKLESNEGKNRAN